MSLLELERLDPPVADPGGPGGPDHPMRKVTVQVAFDPEGWTPERRAKVADLFDSLAPEWHTRYGPGRHAPLVDALDRGEVSGDGHCLELGSGVGLTTALLADRFEVVHALDLSIEMLRRSPEEPAPRVLGDSSRLPYPDRSVATIICQNMLLFPAEVDRVLAPGGALVWVNTSAEFTPIHLTAAEVERALLGPWDVVASSAGRGTWAVARRTHDQGR
ncbi:MAG: class I SAM-dependent methyltransferase [Actinomycetota bacterium]